MQLLFLYPALVSLLLLAPDATKAAKAAKKNPKDAVLLSNVKSLTLRAGKLTSHRRVPAVPQLSCTGPGCAHHKIDIMRCTNAGADYNEEDIQWSCTASLPEEFKLGGTEVICEGYEGPKDERVLKGSCGVEYRLLLTDKGEEIYGKMWWGGGKSKGKSANGGDTGGVEGGSYLAKALFMVLFAAMSIWILSALWQGIQQQRRNPRPRQPRQPRAGFGGGGGGFDDDDDPPPPYSSYPGKRYSSARQSEPWRPGFWSGTAAGAAAGYAAGRGKRTQAQPVQNNNGWFGGGGGSVRRPSRPSGGGGESSSSSARYESTGFGSTSRR